MTSVRVGETYRSGGQTFTVAWVERGLADPRMVGIGTTTGELIEMRDNEIVWRVDGS